MKKILLSLLILISIDLKANTYGNPSINESVISVIATSDSGYLLIGTKGGYQDLYIVKTDHNYHEQWSKVYGDSVYQEFGIDAVQMPDSGFLVLSTKDLPADYKGWLLRLDKNGDTLWSLIYIDTVNGSNTGYISSDIQMFNSNAFYLKFGLNFGGGSGGIDTVPIDSTGMILDTIFYEAPPTNVIYAYNEFTAVNAGIVVNVINPNGTFNNIFYDTNYTYHFYSYGAQLCGSGYIIAGASDYYTSGASDQYFLMRLDSNADSTWSRHWDRGRLTGIERINDNSYYITGYNDSTGIAIYYVAVMDSSGNFQWQYNFSQDIFLRNHLLNGNNLVLFGDSLDTGMGTRQAWLAVFDQNGNLLSHQQPVGIDEILSDEIITYPNPSSGDFHVIDKSGREFDFEIYDLFGRLVMNGKKNHQYLIDGNKILKQGEYILVIKSQDRSRRLKIIKMD